MKIKFRERFKYLLFMFLINSITYSQTTEVNHLDQNYYGFDVTSGDTGWWIQHPDNFSISTDRGYNGSSNSLKFVSSAAFSGNKRAFGGDLASMLINLEPGDYDFKTYVYLSSDSDYTTVGFDIREGSTVVKTFDIDITGIDKDTWVPITKTLTITSKITDARLRVIMNGNYGTTGTMYLDNLSILSYVVKLDDFATITTESNNLLDMSTGTYEISLKVWLDNDCDIPNFFTQIDNPLRTIDWDISSVNKEQWVTLTKTIVIDTPVENSDFKIIVNNTYKSNNYSGTFYIDDINLIKDSLSNNLIEGAKNVIEPNPAKGYININIDSANIKNVTIINTNGGIVKVLENNKSNRFDISSLNSGIYFVKIFSKDGMYIKKLIVE